MQKHIANQQNYVQTNCSSVAYHFDNLFEVILRTRDMVRWGFPDTPFQYGCYIQAVSIPMTFSAAYPAS